MRAVKIIFGVVLLAIAGWGGWRTWTEIRILQDNLGTEHKRVAALSESMSNLARDLELKSAEVTAAHQEVARAKRDATEKAALAVTAETQQQQAEQARLQAEATARDAQGREQAARSELSELQKRRKEELDHMQQALAKIAPTQRTATGMVIELANDSFYFDFDKAELRQQNREILSRIAGVLLASGGYRLFVYGHTDDVGAVDYNQQLSLRRATSVADYLREAGVPEDSMQVKGFGKSNPRVESHTPSARQKNRRVEIGVVDSIIDYDSVKPTA